MRYLTGAAIAFILALVQASSVEQFRILGVAPNLLLVFLVAWLVVRGLDDVLPMVAVAGITMGFVGLQAPGVVLLALLPLAGLGMLREMHVVQSEVLLALLLAVGATLAFETIMLFGVAATGGRLDLLTGFRSVVIPCALVNLAMTPFVYFFMRFARPDERRHRLSY